MVPSANDGNPGTEERSTHASEINVAVFRWKWIALFWVGTLLPLAVSIPYWPYVLRQDKSHVSIAIVALFIMGLVVNQFRYTGLVREIGALNTIHGSTGGDTVDNLSNEGSVIERHWNNLREMARRDSRPDQEVLIESNRARLMSKESFPRLVSSSLITLGLIGTIIGLVISLGGLQETIRQSSTRNLVQSIQGTLSGMGTAFFTTLIGAVLGGILLRFQNNLLRTYTTRFLASLSEVTEVYLIPELRNQRDTFDGVDGERLDRVVRRMETENGDSTEQLGELFDRLSERFQASGSD